MNFKSLHGAKPDVSLHNPDAVYMRSLVTACDMTQVEAAKALGLSERVMRYYLSQNPDTFRPAPYTVQYALEQLAACIAKVDP